MEAIPWILLIGVQIQNGGGHIWAWEPDSGNREKCRKTFEENDIKYKLVSKGLWSEASELRFRMSGGSSSIRDSGNVVVEVDSIDNLVDRPITFIKMDIEGAEYQALLGAKNVIKKYKPKLAICTYHKPEDVWEIPWLLHKINSEYTFYMRHYSFGDVETVLYGL